MVSRSPAPSRPAVVASKAMLDVQVPEDAEVYVNGASTQSTGTSRRYIWSQLRPGRIIEVEVRVELTLAGKRIQQTKKTQIRADELGSLSFDFDNPETRLTVNVPDDAIVYLSGSQTSGTGPVRTFSTTRLANGQQWSGYSIRVSLERNGQLLSKEQTISIRSGDSKSLTFDFDAGAVAVAD